MEREQSAVYRGKRFSDWGDGGASWFEPPEPEEHVDPINRGEDATSFPSADQVFEIRDHEL